MFSLETGLAGVAQLATLLEGKPVSSVEHGVEDRVVLHRDATWTLDSGLFFNYL
jgi:hypothetical protein